MNFGDILFSDKARSVNQRQLLRCTCSRWNSNKPNLFQYAYQGKVQMSLQVFRHFRFQQPTIPNHTEPYLTIPNQQSPSITQDLENGADLNNGDTFGEDWALQSWSYQDAVAANQRLASSSYHPVQMQWTRDEGNLTPRTIRNRTDSIFHDFPIDFFEIQPYSTFQNIFLPKTCVLVASSHGVSSINS